jgi:hypothetical protein
MKKLLAASAVLLAGCVTIPDGPAVMVLPGSTKTFDQFRADDADCRGYATAQIGGKSAIKDAESVLKSENKAELERGCCRPVANALTVPPALAVGVLPSGQPSAGAIWTVGMSVFAGCGNCGSDPT